jgi:hypothetical protein
MLLNIPSLKNMSEEKLEEMDVWLKKTVAYLEDVSQFDIDIPAEPLPMNRAAHLLIDSPFSVLETK